MAAVPRNHLSHAGESISARHRRSRRARLPSRTAGFWFATAASSRAATTRTIRDANPGAATIDWRGGFILPGFVDAHVHFPQVRIIGAMGRTLLDWLETVALPEEARMADRGYAADTARLFLRALASHGTTTALVFGAHFADATARAVRGGRRVRAAHRVRARASPTGCSGRTCTSLRSARIAKAQLLIERYHKRGRLLYAVTPRFAYSTTEAMLEVCQQLMTEHPDVRLQTHINENTAEIAELARLFPWAADYLAIYERYDLSGNRSVMAHNVHATPSEIERLAAAGTAVAHCPGSNAALGSGCFPLRRHVDAGVTCALGTDVGGGLGFGMLKEGLQAYLMQRLAPDPEPLDAARLLYWRRAPAPRRSGSRRRSAISARARRRISCICVRRRAACSRRSCATPTDPRQALAALFTLAGAESVREVRVEGRCRILDG